MFNKIPQLAICILVIGATLYSTAAVARDLPDEERWAELNEKCDLVKERFSESLAFGDRGTTWGRVYKCETSKGPKMFAQSASGH